MAKYKYSYHEERGEFSAYVEDEKGNVVWEVRYPDYYEDDETGELVESNTIFDDGYMRNVDDTKGLHKYLTSMGIMKDSDKLLQEHQFADGGKIPDEISRLYEYLISEFKNTKFSINSVKGLTDTYRIRVWDDGFFSYRDKKFRNYADELENKFKNLEIRTELRLYNPQGHETDTIVVKQKNSYADGGEVSQRWRDKKIYAVPIDSEIEVKGERIPYFYLHKKAMKINGYDICNANIDAIVNCLEQGAFLCELHFIDGNVEDAICFSKFDYPKMEGLVVLLSDVEGIESAIDYLDFKRFPSMEDSEEKYLSSIGLLQVISNNMKRKFADGGITKYKKVRTLKEAQKDPRVENIYFEPNDYREKEGSWWIELREGFTCRSMSCGTIHEDTLKEVLDLLNNDVVEEQNSYADGGVTTRRKKLDEYETYHKTLASALDEAERFVNNRGYEFSEDKYFPDLTMGGVKYGETISTKRDLVEIGGKDRKNTLILVVYRMDSGTYELTMYFAKSNFASGGYNMGKGSIVTDRADRQRIINSIREGETILRGKVKGEEREAILRQVNKSKEKLGLKPNEKMPYGYMASGGTLENKLKKKLTESFELPMEMAVYVPSTDKANIIISKRDYASRIEEVERYLSDLFGGYSAVSVDGGYVSDDKGLIQEDVTRVATFGSTENFESKFTKLINKVVDWCNKWGQESMGFEFEGDMFYIDKKASFKHGGQVYTK